MHIHFSEEEFAGRQRAAAEAAAAAGFDGLLIFKQESMFYLTGYDTFGFCFFQCLWLGADGRMALLTRAPTAARRRSLRCSTISACGRTRPTRNPSAT